MSEDKEFYYRIGFPAWSLKTGEYVVRVQVRGDNRMWFKTHVNRWYVIDDNEEVLRADLRILTNEEARDLQLQMYRMQQE